jgi:hypothetical protein
VSAVSQCPREQRRGQNTVEYGLIVVAIVLVSCWGSARVGPSSHHGSLPWLGASQRSARRPDCRSQRPIIPRRVGGVPLRTSIAAVRRAPIGRTGRPGANSRYRPSPFLGANRGEPQAAGGCSDQKETPARRIRDGREEMVSSSDLRKGDVVLVRENEIIPRLMGRSSTAWPI